MRSDDGSAPSPSGLTRASAAARCGLRRTRRASGGVDAAPVGRARSRPPARRIPAGGGARRGDRVVGATGRRKPARMSDRARRYGARTWRNRMLTGLAGQRSTLAGPYGRGADAEAHLRRPVGGGASRGREGARQLPHGIGRRRLACLRHLPDGRQRRSDGCDRRGRTGPRRREPARLRRLDLSDDPLRQHQRARDHGRREDRRCDPGRTPAGQA